MSRLERDMTPAEIEAATDNPDVDWGFIYCGTRSIGQTLWRRIVLWFGIVGRVNQADYRTGPILAWQICGCIHPTKPRSPTASTTSHLHLDRRAISASAWKRTDGWSSSVIPTGVGNSASM